MPPLKSLDVFSSFSVTKTKFIELWEDSDYIELIASADTRGVIGLANLELACLSHGKKYKRTFGPSSRHLPKDESFEWPNHDGLSIRIVTGDSSFRGISIEQQNVSIESSNVEVVFEDSDGTHQGVLDSLGIVTFLVNEILPQAPKIKRMRPLMLAGQWLRKSMESNYDPIYMKLRDALLDDGLIRLLPMVEVEEDDNKEINKPKKGGSKKFYVYVKNEKGNIIKLGFGDPNMEIKRDDPARRKSFRARHNCSDPGPKWKARYWSCYQWRAGAKVDN
mgnify:CR=1 FL=1